MKTKADPFRLAAAVAERAAAAAEGEGLSGGNARSFITGYLEQELAFALSILAASRAGDAAAYIKILRDKTAA